MALNSTRSAWSIATQSLRPLLQPCSSSSAAAASSSFAISSVSATAAVSCRRAQYHDIARTPTALREQDDPLNKPATETDLEEARPRWAYTPEAMKGRHGFSLNHIRKPHRAIWHVNEDPVLLDNFYERFLGRNGSKLLPDELKWLAVTHKSFDYGRRGFNTRLAFFGRQILVVEAMNAIMTRPMTIEPHLGDPWKRDHFVSPALQNIDKLSVDRPQDLMSVDALARVGMKTQLDQVMRWKPRIPENLKSSGINVVLSTTIFAIIGAVSLQHGGEVASKIAREKVLGRLSQAST